MSTTQMDEATRAMCFAYRNPGAGQKPLKLTEIRKLIKKKNKRSRPTLQAISQAAKNFLNPKQKRGRKIGQRKTTKEEDKTILKKFHKLRPPGHGIVARKVKKALPKKLAMKVSKRLIIRRLAEKGFTPQKKESKSDLGPKLQQRRLRFCRKYQDKDANTWKTFLQAVGDFKEFTFYPRELQPKFQQLRSSWTYMTDKERKLPKFQRPKKWFPKKEWDKTKHIKVFGITTSTGRQLSFEVPMGKGQYDGHQFAAHVRKKIGPFLRRAFPGRTSFHILLDGEKVQHTPEAKRAMAEFGITTLKDWPAQSPELNPQEHVWSRAEPDLRELETGYDSFDPWKKKVFTAIRAYTGAHKLVGTMARKIQDCIARKGAMIDD